jgi:conjugal transfer/entry exclusion protein
MLSFKVLSRLTLVVCSLWPALGLSQSANCLQSTTYFAGFYQDLYTMHRHGLDTFATDSAERQMYFFQVQRSGEKLEANIVKSVQADNSLSASDKKQRIQLHHAVGQRVRAMAEIDAQNTQPKDKANVLLALQEVCL